MKKVISIVIAAALCVCLLMPFVVAAEPIKVSFSGPSEIRQGDTVTVTFQLGGSNLYGASGELSYDATQLQPVEKKQLVAAPWMVEWNGNRFVAYDNNLAKPINSKTAIFSVTFKVKAAAGAAVNVQIKNATASDGSSDIPLGTVAFSKTVAAPFSGDNALAALTVSNATLSPAFAADVTKYTAKVPFEVEKLELTAAAADAKAKVKVNNPTLTPNGTTNVSVTVTAENGQKKVYTIAVSREKDPNYVASSNNTLASITVEGFVLSPVFSEDVTEYVVWLPYETESLTVSGKSKDGKASVQVVGGEALVAGEDNEVKVICTAEDGTAKEYTVIAKRAAAHGVTDTPADTPADTPVDTPADAQSAGFAWWWLVVTGIGGAVLGLLLGLLIKKK